MLRSLIILLLVPELACFTDFLRFGGNQLFPKEAVVSGSAADFFIAQQTWLQAAFARVRVMALRFLRHTQLVVAVQRLVQPTQPKSGLRDLVWQRVTRQLLQQLLPFENRDLQKWVR